MNAPDPRMPIDDFFTSMSKRSLSANFTAADLCCAGETWQRSRVANEPRQMESWHALASVCENILEPVRARFGTLEITYGFTAPALIKLIKAHSAPYLDQHASCEINARGNLICPRLGAAVDFRVKAGSLELAIWIAETLPFDRLYFYGPDRPVHVSYGPDKSGLIVAMLAGQSQRRVPKVIRLDWLKELRSDLAHTA